MEYLRWRKEFDRHSQMYPLIAVGLSRKKLFQSMRPVDQLFPLSKNDARVVWVEGWVSIFDSDVEGGEMSFDISDMIESIK